MKLCWAKRPPMRHLAISSVSFLIHVKTSYKNTYIIFLLQYFSVEKLRPRFSDIYSVQLGNSCGVPSETVVRWTNRNGNGRSFIIK